MNANELADKLMSSLTMEYDCDETMEYAATMLRKINSDNVRLLKAYGEMAAHVEALKKETEALTREKIKEIHEDIAKRLPDMWNSGESTVPFYVEYARAIERAHGIGE